MDCRILNGKAKTSVAIVVALGLLLTTVVGYGSPGGPVDDIYQNGSTEETMIRTYEFSEPEVMLDNGISILGMENTITATNLWEPQLPAVYDTILIPYGREVVSVEAALHGVTSLGYGFELHTTDAAILSENVSMQDIRDSNRAEYVQSEVYPRETVTYNTAIIRGYKVLSINLYPVEYHTQSGELRSYSYADVEITLEYSGVQATTYRGLERDREHIGQILGGELPQDIIDTYPVSQDRLLSSVDYLMITTEDLFPGFQPLVHHKEARGLSVAVEFVSDIENDYSGVDTQDKIRNCIIDYYQNHGITFVNLAGDTTDSEGNPIVPHRGLYGDCTSIGGTVDEIPSDYYYGGLDGTWDANGNGVYGEWADDPDWGMDVWVGRMPAQNSGEASVLTNKVISWESSTCTEVHYSHGENDVGNLGDFRRNKAVNTQHSTAVHNIIPSHWTINTDFESEKGTITPQQYIAGISGESSGGVPPMFVNHGGHGGVTFYHLGGAIFSRPDAESMVNDFFPIHATPACTSGSFDGRDNFGSYSSDRDCLAESFLKNPNGGMVATFMNTRWGIGTTDGCTGYSGALDTNLYHGIFTQGYNNLGAAAQWARQDFILGKLGGTSQQRELSRFVVHSMNYLGCPEMPVISVGSIEIELVVDSDNGGWNFISFNTLPNDTSIENLLSGIHGQYDRVMYFSSPYEPEYQVQWNEIFETGDGWTFSGGEWEIDEPQGLGGTDFGNPDPEEAYAGSQVLGYDLTDDGDYEANIEGTYWATSPSIDLTGSMGTIVEFQRWLNVGWGTNKHYASFEVYDGSDWYLVWQNSEQIEDDSWNEVSFDVSLYADNNPDFRMRFGMGPTSSGFIQTRFSGWNIDDINVKSMIYVRNAGYESWRSYMPGRASRFNRITDIDLTMGIWIRVTSTTSLDVEGYSPLHTAITLTPGWNMVGYPSFSTRNADEVLPPEVTKVGFFNPSIDGNLEYTTDLGSLTLSPGQGYLLYNSADHAVSWSVY